MECMNCKGDGCINCQPTRLDPACDVADIQRSRDEADAEHAIVLYDPNLRPDQFDGVPADTR